MEVAFQEKETTIFKECLQLCCTNILLDDMFSYSKLTMKVLFCKRLKTHKEYPFFKLGNFSPSNAVQKSRLKQFSPKSYAVISKNVINKCHHSLQLNNITKCIKKRGKKWRGEQCSEIEQNLRKNNSKRA